VVSIGKVGGSPGAERYYTDAVARGQEDYYAGSGEAPGEWYGTGAAAVGLSGTVDGDEFSSLFRGVTPSGQRLRQEPDERSVVVAAPAELADPARLAPNPIAPSSPAAATAWNCRRVITFGCCASSWSSRVSSIWEVMPRTVRTVPRRSWGGSWEDAVSFTVDELAQTHDGAARQQHRLLTGGARTS